MGKIRVLPEVLAHKIAAGEIVERPASVVKELLENALDAQASRIVVRSRNGGMRLICVCDDGVGMNPEDARLAFEHHATSKIVTFEDLSHIHTLGFRGEALPSIASVSRLRLRSREDTANGESPLGTEIEYEGGKLQRVGEISWPAGTEVSVEDLFFNVPARKSFLKSVSTELGHLNRQVIHYALANPHVEFQLVHQDRVVLEAAQAPTLAERVYQILGESFLEHLVSVDYTKQGVHLSGFASLPHEQRSNSSSQFLFVNGRMVRDRVLTHAIHLAYRGLLPSGTYPAVLLFVEIDPQQIDVNVHPCKTEIRFRDSHTLHSTIYHGIEEALLRGKSSGFAGVARDVLASKFAFPSSGVLTQPGGRDSKSATSLGAIHSFQRPGDRLSFSPSQPGKTDRPGRDPEGFTPSNGDPHRFDIPETADLSPSLILLGQFVESFLVAADREGVMLVDQHVAHERILYEQALRALESSPGCPTQRLLIPITLELSASQKLTLEKVLDGLNGNGFEVEWFGAQTIAVKGVPAVASECDVKRLIREILERFDGEDTGLVPLSRLREKIAISVSCRAAIKINTPLSREKMQWMLDELLECRSPYTCPHGRPIVLRLNIEDILRGFKRI